MYIYIYIHAYILLVYYNYYHDVVLVSYPDPFEGRREKGVVPTVCTYV